MHCAKCWTPSLNLRATPAQGAKERPTGFGRKRRNYGAFAIAHHARNHPRLSRRRMSCFNHVCQLCVRRFRRSGVIRSTSTIARNAMLPPPSVSSHSMSVIQSPARFAALIPVAQPLKPILHTGTSLAGMLGLGEGEAPLRSWLVPSLNCHEPLHRRCSTPSDSTATRVLALAQRVAHLASDRGRAWRLVHNGN